MLKPDGFDLRAAPSRHAKAIATNIAVKRIIDFYQRQSTNYADYFIAAWRFKYRAALGNPNATLADFAAETKSARSISATSGPL